MKNLKEKGILKTVLASATAITLCSTLFLGANNAMLAMAMGKAEDIPTAYNIAPVVYASEPADYVKADYKVVELQNPASRAAKDQASFANAISKEDAAETGAQYIWDFYGVDLSGKTIQMFYFIEPERLRTYWAGDIYESEDDIFELSDDLANFDPANFKRPTFGFTVDAVTGEVTSISKNYSPVEGKETTPFDPAKTEELWKNNCDEHLQLAAKAGEKHLGAKIVSTEFKGVTAYGVINNRPTGENTTSGVQAAEPASEGENAVLKWKVTSVSGADDTMETKCIDTMEAECIMIVALVTDEYGRQCELTITTDTKEIMIINTIVPRDPNGAVGVG